VSAADLFLHSFGHEPGGLFAAPGRVNLIGEHTDYTGGLVLPFAIDALAVMAAGRNSDDVVRVVSAQRPGEVQTIQLAEWQPDTPMASSWAGYVFGAVWALRRAGHTVDGFDLALHSQVPSGAGLSSSAAVECVTALAVSTLSGLHLAPLEIARLAQQAENDFVGVPCGPMDQTASAAARAGSVLLFDTAANTIEHIPFDPAASDLSVLVIDTRVTHSLADGEYAKRRASCEKATDILGVASLRDLSVEELPAALAKLGDDVLGRRVHHVVTENDRVARTVELLRAGDVAGIADLLVASHRSLQHDYEVSCPELDEAVESALAAGAIGARMTGGGFGGSIVALVPTDLVDAVIRGVNTAFDRRHFTAPVPRLVTPSDGARQISQK
jgi:galactokinase